MQSYNQSCLISHQARLKIVAFISGLKFIITRISVVILYMTLLVHLLNVTRTRYQLQKQQATVYLWVTRKAPRVGNVERILLPHTSSDFRIRMVSAYGH